MNTGMINLEERQIIGGRDILRDGLPQALKMIPFGSAILTGIVQTPRRLCAGAVMAHIHGGGDTSMVSGGDLANLNRNSGLKVAYVFIPFNAFIQMLSMDSFANVKLIEGTLYGTRPGWEAALKCYMIGNDLRICQQYDNEINLVQALTNTSGQKIGYVVENSYGISASGHCRYVIAKDDLGWVSQLFRMKNFYVAKAAKPYSPITNYYAAALNGSIPAVKVNEEQVINAISNNELSLRNVFAAKYGLQQEMTTVRENCYTQAASIIPLGDKVSVTVGDGAIPKGAVAVPIGSVYGGQVVGTNGRSTNEKKNLQYVMIKWYKVKDGKLMKPTKDDCTYNADTKEWTIKNAMVVSTPALIDLSKQGLLWGYTLDDQGYPKPTDEITDTVKLYEKNGRAMSTEGVRCWVDLPHLGALPIFDPMATRIS